MGCVYMPMSMPSLRWMSLGTVADVRSSRDAKPMVLSIWALSSSEGLLCLWQNLEGGEGGAGGQEGGMSAAEGYEALIAPLTGTASSAMEESVFR